MPSGNVNLNQRVSAPYGDIFFPQTTAIDKAANLLYQQQQQREAQQRSEQKALDDEFSKNMSGMRDVDIPDLTQKYNDYKQASMMLNKQRVVSPQQQMELLKKKSDLFSLINASKGQRAIEDDMYKRTLSPNNDFEDDARPKILKIKQTPILSMPDELKNYDPTDRSANKDLSGLFMKLKGKNIDIYGESKPNPNDKTKFDVPVYQISSTTPDQYKNNLMGALMDRKTNKAAIYQFKQVPEAQVYDVNEKVNSIPDEVWAKLNLKKPNLTVNNPNNEAEQAANYYAQLHALDIVNSAQNPSKYITKSNGEEAQNFRANQGELNRAATRSNILLRNQLGMQNPEGDNTWRPLVNNIGSTEPVEVKIKRAGILNSILPSKNAVIKNGAVTVDGNPYNGDINIPSNKLDSYGISLAEKNGVLDKGAEEYTANVKDGKIISLTSGRKTLIVDNPLVGKYNEKITSNVKNQPEVKSTKKVGKFNNL